MDIARFIFIFSIFAILSNCTPQDFATSNPYESDMQPNPRITNSPLPTGDVQVGKGNIVASSEVFKNCSLKILMRQTSSFVVTNNSDFIAIGRIQDKPVYGLAESGKGRLAFSGDTNLIGLEDQKCAIWPWLGGTYPRKPRVLVFGRWICNSKSAGAANGIAQYLGVVQAGEMLPAQYINNPALLKKDYDMVLFCSNVKALATGVGQTLIDFVRNYGGGLYMAHEYGGFASSAETTALNTLTQSFGVSFKNDSISWNDIDIAVDFNFK